jgi:hypothetical protein
MLTLIVHIHGVTYRTSTCMLLKFSKMHLQMCKTYRYTPEGQTRTGTLFETIIIFRPHANSYRYTVGLPMTYSRHAAIVF